MWHKMLMGMNVEKVKYLFCISLIALILIRFCYILESTIHSNKTSILLPLQVLSNISSSGCFVLLLHRTLRVIKISVILFGVFLNDIENNCCRFDGGEQTAIFGSNLRQKYFGANWIFDHCFLLPCFFTA